ncbi:MAG: MarR family transcriptional regulator [Acidimicrobiia bacterium]|nr:MarR family transcriptional regulator [Acidimicrobiia bacterium]MBV9040542.1 MarR family transcriptional regulator [Acidimicrobiia bacterium]
MAALHDADYQRLLEFRDGLRVFLRWSEEQAAAVGLTPAHHQLLLAVRGHSGPQAPTVSDVAEHLQLRRHSVVGLINRAEAAGLLERTPDAADQRVVRLRLTRLGARRLEQLSALHLEELRRLAPRLRPVWDGLEIGSD